MTVQPRLHMEDIAKSFPGVQALKGVSLDLRPGEVHALVGENGAGKSTLVKIITGIHPTFSGVYEYEGAPARFRSIRDAQEAGISIVHQELNMMADLTVAQNIFIGRESPSLRISDRDLNRRAQALIDDYEIGVDPRTPLRDLTVSKAQIVEIARALSFQETKVLILDEPTAALSEAESAELLERVRGLRQRGVSIVYVSHRMHEIMDVSDRITVLRDGTHVGTLETASTTMDEIIELMVGRQVVNAPKSASAVPADAAVVLEADRLSSADVTDVSFELRTPLTTIRMASDQLYAARTEIEDPLARRSAELLNDQVDRFQTMLTDLLEISRIDSGRVELRVSQEDLREVVRRVLSAVEVHVTASGAQVHLDLGDQPATAQMDVTRVERIVRNLVTNAIEHAEGSVIGLDDTDDDSRRAAEELGFDLGRRPGGATASTVDEI